MPYFAFDGNFKVSMYALIFFAFLSVAYSDVLRLPFIRTVT